MSWRTVTTRLPRSVPTPARVRAWVAHGYGRLANTRDRALEYNSPCHTHAKASGQADLLIDRSGGTRYASRNQSVTALTDGSWSGRPFPIQLTTGNVGDA